MNKQTELYTYVREYTGINPYEGGTKESRLYSYNGMRQIYRNRSRGSYKVTKIRRYKLVLDQEYTPEEFAVTSAVNHWYLITYQGKTYMRAYKTLDIDVAHDKAHSFIWVKTRTQPRKEDIGIEHICSSDE